MKKHILIITLGVSLASSLAVANSGVFVGVEAGMMQSKFKDDATDFKDKVGNFGAKIGYQFTQNFRIYGAYNMTTNAKHTSDDGEINFDITAHKFLAGLDFTPKIIEDFRAVVGVYGGISQINKDIEIKMFGKKSDAESDVIYGGKVGILYAIGSGEIEGGFRAERASYGVVESIELFGETIDTSLKQTSYGLYLGYNYKF